MNESNSRYSRSEGRFGVFSVSESAATTQYRRINSIPVEFRSWREHKVTVQLMATCLDPDSQTAPLILLRRTNRSEYGGFDGQDIIFTSPHGFDKAIAVDIFTRFRPDEGLSNGDVRYGPTDEKGFLTILQLHFDRGTTVYTAYKWNGQGFVVFETQTVKIDERIYSYDWNGEKLVPKSRTAIPVSP